MPVTLGLEPVRMDFSGQADSTGAFTLSQKTIRQAFWSNVKVVATATGGNPKWLAQVNGSPAATGLGPQTEMGPILVGPTEKVDIIMTGANANAQVRGQFVGIQAPTLDTILSNFAPQPNTISMQQSAPTQALGSFQVTLGSSANKTFQLPYGALGVLVEVSGTPRSTDSVIVQGPTTGAQYLNTANTPIPQGTVGCLVDQAQDPQVNVQYSTLVGSGTITVYVSALMTAAAIMALLNTQMPVTLQDFAGNSIASDGANSLVGGNPNNLDVSLARAQPAPWQAPSSVAAISIDTSVAGATAAIIAGVANKRIYLHDLNYDVSAAGAFAGHWEDTAGNNLGNTTLQNNGSRDRSYSGFPIATGNGFRFNVTNTGASFIVGHVTYSQA